MLCAMADARVNPAAAAHAHALKRWWATGDGAARWATWYELRRQLAEEIKGMRPAELDGLTTNIYRMRYHRMPPHSKGSKGHG
jgi:hypothetical protein